MILLQVTNPPPGVVSPRINSHPQSASKPKQVPPGSVPAPQAAKFQNCCWSRVRVWLCQTLSAELGGLLLPVSHPNPAPGAGGAKAGARSHPGASTPSQLTRRMFQHN